jgi:TRAP-type transport system periplasmic protein
MPVRMRVTPCAAILVAALVAAAGCGGSTSDKAGGTHHAATVLTIANTTGTSRELDAWAREVQTRSGGTLRIRFANMWRGGELDNEVGLIHDVQAAKVDMGWVGSRALDAVGVRTFEALHAPFVIDSYSLEQAVLQSPIPDEMMRGLGALRVVGLGVLPGPLRRPLSAPHPLRGPADYAGLRIGYVGGAEAADTLRALGARPVRLVPGPFWPGIDAVEQQLAAINGNGYDSFAHYLTANVVLWPRPVVLFMNLHRFARLTSGQQRALTGAARRVLAQTTDVQRAMDHGALEDLCRRRIALVGASAADIDGLHAATAPLLRRLERRPDARAWITAILGMRRQVAPAGEQPLRCPNASPPQGGGLPDGDYTTSIQRGDAARELARIPRAARNEAGLSPDGVRDILGSEFTLSLRHGTFLMRQRHADGRREVGITGTFSLFRDRFVGKGSNGDTLRARWSFDGTRLRFTDFSFPGAYRLVWASEAWIRSG